MPPSLSSNSSQTLLTFNPSLLLEYNTGTTENLGKHEEPEDKNPHFLYTRMIPDVTRLSVNRWSPLSHTSHSITTSRPAAATQTRARVSPVMQPKVFLCRMPFLPLPSLFPGSRTGLECAGLHTLKLGLTIISCNKETHDKVYLLKYKKMNILILWHK